MRTPQPPPCARPGLVLFVQTFGDLVYIKAHLHVLAADGVFGADGTFIALPPVPEALTCRRFSARSVIARSFTRNASTARRARRVHDPGSHVAREDDLWRCERQISAVALGGKYSTSQSAIEKSGFTQYKKSGGGVYERTAGEVGPEHLFRK